MKRLITMTLLTSALFAAPAVQAASYQDRAMGTSAVVGATTGAVIGSGQNQAVEGAIFGAVLGTIAGAVIASQYQPPVYVERQVRVHHKPAAHRQVQQPRHKYAQHHTERAQYGRHNTESRAHQYTRHATDSRQYTRYADNRSYGRGHERGDRH